jgi:predicted dehydrogenase
VRLGIVGRGRWGNTYAETLTRLGIDFWQAGRDYREHLYGTDGVIIACATPAHYEVAFDVIEDGYPALIEKPVTLKTEEAESLLRLAEWRNGNIALVGHTRLYSPAWREFKRPAKVVRATVADWWDWGPHAVSMAFDLGCENPEITVGGERMTFSADGRVFDDVKTDPAPLEVLVREFVAAIESGKPNNEGLQLGLKVVQYLESHEPSRLHGA